MWTGHQNFTNMTTINRTRLRFLDIISQSGIYNTSKCGYMPPLQVIIDWTPFFPPQRSCLHSPCSSPVLPCRLPALREDQVCVGRGGALSLCAVCTGFCSRVYGMRMEGVNVLLHNFPAAHTHHFILPGPLAGLQFDRGVEKGQDPWTASDFMCCGSYPHFFPVQEYAR